MAIERGKFEENEIKQAGDVWITTYASMERVFGKVKDEKESFIIYDDFQSILFQSVHQDIKISMAKSDYKRNKAGEAELEKQKAAAKKINDEVKEMLKEALQKIRAGGKVIIKKRWKDGEVVMRVINSEKELLSFVKILDVRRYLTTKKEDEFAEYLKTVK